MRRRKMQSKRGVILCAATLVSFAALAQSGRSYGPDRIWWGAGVDGLLPWTEAYDDPEGELGIFNEGGAVHTKGHPFFEPLGVNGRACVTCHQPSNAMSVSTARLRERWVETHGQDPVFAAVDGSNCPDMPLDRKSSHSLLLERGLFRISLPWPPRTPAGTPIQPEFRLEVVRDPTGCNSGPLHGPNGAERSVSVYRRPRMAANLTTLVRGSNGIALMADGREPSLESQAITAATVHEQATAHPTLEQLRQILDFETRIYVAQHSDLRGGLLNERGGPTLLSAENLASGKAGTLGTGVPPTGSFLFAVWKQPAEAKDLGLQRDFRASVERGSDLFYSRRFRMEGVTSEAVAGTVTCASCHASGTKRWMDIGTAKQTAESSEHPAELPLFRATCENSATPGAEIYTSDPGRALITGKCADIGAIVMPQFRGLAARAPYFSNGSAQNLGELVDYYDQHFDIGFTEREKHDLVNFLKVL